MKTLERLVDRLIERWRLDLIHTALPSICIPGLQIIADGCPQIVWHFSVDLPLWVLYWTLTMRLHLNSRGWREVWKNGSISCSEVWWPKWAVASGCLINRGVHRVPFCLPYSESWSWMSPWTVQKTVFAHTRLWWWLNFVNSSYTPKYCLRTLANGYEPAVLQYQGDVYQLW
jgi:hypothetical protein